MAAAPQTLPQHPVPSGSSSGSGTSSATGTTTATVPAYQQHHMNYNAQPPLYHYSTPPIYQNHDFSPAANVPPPSFPSNHFFPPSGLGLGQPHPGLPQHSYPVPMSTVTAHYPHAAFDPIGFQQQQQMMQSQSQTHSQSDKTVSDDSAWEDVGPSKQANNERFYSGGRQRTPVEAARLFEQQYQICSKPSKEIRANLSQRSGLPLRTVQIWFQNRRAKDVLEAKRAVMAQAAAASAAAVAAGLPPPPPPPFPSTKRQMMRVPSNSTDPTDSTHLQTPTTGRSHTHTGSANGYTSHPGSASASSVSTTPDVGHASLPDSNTTPNSNHTYNEAGPSSAPPIMAPNNPIMYPQQVNSNPGFYGYAYPSVGATAVGAIGPLGSPARMGRRSSIANGEAANISTIVQRQQRGSIGAASAARRGSIPYPPSIHSALMAANAGVNVNAPTSPHHQAHRNGGHNVGGVMSSPLSPQGSASQLAKTALRNNSRRASMPGNGGLFGMTVSNMANLEPSTSASSSSTIVPTHPFTPPRTVSGTGPSAPLPSDGRVTRELPPSTDQSELAQAKAALSTHNDASAQTTPTRSSSGNTDSVFTLPSRSSTDSFVQPMLPCEMDNGGGGSTGLGPLPNPTFVFGNAQSQTQQGMINYGIDETYLSMQDRSRLNSLASIGTYASEVPTDLSSDFGSNGTLEYLPVPESYDLYTRRASAPADLIDGMGMVGLNPMGANINQPIRPSPLGQGHSFSSDHLRTQANMATSMQYGYNIGLGLPMSGSTSPSTAGTAATTADYPQPTAQWNPALSYAPLSSRQTSNSTDNIYTPSSFFPDSSTGTGTAASFEAQIQVQNQSQDWTTNIIPHLSSRPSGFTDFLASLNYADQVVPEEDEEENKEHLGLAFQPDQIDNLVLQP